MLQCKRRHFDHKSPAAGTMISYKKIATLQIVQL